MENLRARGLSGVASGEEQRQVPKILHFLRIAFVLFVLVFPPGELKKSPHCHHGSMGSLPCFPSLPIPSFLPSLLPSLLSPIPAPISNVANKQANVQSMFDMYSFSFI